MIHLAGCAADFGKFRVASRAFPQIIFGRVSPTELAKPAAAQFIGRLALLPQRSFGSAGSVELNNGFQFLTGDGFVFAFRRSPLDTWKIKNIHLELFDFAARPLEAF